MLGYIVHYACECVFVYMWENEKLDQFYKYTKLGLNKFETSFWNFLLGLHVLQFSVFGQIKKILSFMKNAFWAKPTDMHLCGLPILLYYLAL